MDSTVFEEAASGNQSLIRRLQQHSVDPQQKTPQKNTILHIASMNNQQGISKEVLRLCPWQLHQANTDGNSPLHAPAKIGSEEMVTLLIDGSEDVESQQYDIIGMKNLKEKDTALHVAVKIGRFVVAKLLMEKDPGSLDLVNNDNESPLFLAVEGGFLNIAQHILLQFPSAQCCGSNGMNALHAAVIQAFNARKFEYRVPDLSLEEVRHLLCSFLLHAGNKCVNVGYRKANQPTQTGGNGLAEEKDVLGWTPLHCAAHLGHIEATKLLLQNSSTCIAHLQDNKGMSALHIAAKQGHVDDKDVKSNRLKNISTIHILVATLIATVTFTAGFIMPGGFEQNESSRKGLALLSDNTYFHLFVIADSLAFYCSSASVFLQFCSAWEHNYHLLLRFTKVSASLIYISSLGMAVAFTSSLHAVMPGSSMLAYYTFVSGICCVVAYILGFL
nr:ankyrin-1-like [Ziziphus jujuba var. spinosa]